MLCLAATAVIVACESEPPTPRFDCGERDLPSSQVCDRVYDCADRRDEADCGYNGTSGAHPIEAWDFDALAAMQSALDGTPNEDASFLIEALSRVDAADLERIRTIDWSVATPGSILREPALGRVFQAIILHYEAQQDLGASAEMLIAGGEVGASRRHLVESCATEVVSLETGVRDGIAIVSGTVLAGTGAVALGAAVCVASVVCGVVAAAAVVAGVVTAIDTTAGRAIRRLALGEACASEEGICGSCRAGECICPSYCPAPAGCGPDAGGPDGGAARDAEAAFDGAVEDPDAGPPYEPPWAGWYRGQLTYSADTTGRCPHAGVSADLWVHVRANRDCALCAEGVGHCGGDGASCSTIGLSYSTRIYLGSGGPNATPRAAAADVREVSAELLDVGGFVFSYAPSPDFWETFDLRGLRIDRTDEVPELLGAEADHWSLSERGAPADMILYCPLIVAGARVGTATPADFPGVEAFTWRCTDPGGADCSCCLW